MLWTYSQNNKVDVVHTLFFWIISINFNSLAPTKKKNICPLYVLVWIFTHIRIFTSSMTLSTPPNFFPWKVYVRTPQMWKSQWARMQDVVCMVRLEEQSIWDFYFILCFQTCTLLSVVILEENFSGNFVKSGSSEFFSTRLKSWNVQICVKGLTTLHNVEQNHPIKQWPWLYLLKG